MLPLAVAVTPFWFFLAWLAVLLFFSPILFLIGVCLPELPLLLVQRFYYMPFDAV